MYEFICIKKKGIFFIQIKLVKNKINGIKKTTFLLYILVTGIARKYFG